MSIDQRHSPGAMATTDTHRSEQLCTVLLVDDEPFLLSAFARSLRHQPYRILSACSAEEAMQVLTTDKVDLIVSDQRMPGMCGVELLSWVARNYPSITRILLTADASSDPRTSDFRRSDFFRVLSKPCKLGELARTIRDGLSPQK